jgi:lipopolysaccharide/colanic/teichoic acid biosynthesis glycosyltransferase
MLILQSDEPRTESIKTAEAKPPRWRRSWYAIAKHPIDCGLAVLFLVLTLPILLLAAMAVKLTSRGPIFYLQTRLGRNGHPFSIYKIRTMLDNCERLSGICWSGKGDPRITMVGRFLRVTHIDELPQFWNVLRGDMSIVGPRPERPEFYPGLEQEVPRYRERICVRPGITGLAQVQLASDTDIESVRHKLAQDLHYIEKQSFWLDARIVAGTILLVVGLPAAVGRVLFALPSEKPVAAVRRRNKEENVETPLPSYPDCSASANPTAQFESA